MTKVSSTGKNLSIFINCQYTPEHDWMAYASWYSISKNIPDAEVGLLVEKTGITRYLFGWTYQCRVCRVAPPEFTAPTLFIDADVMAVRPLDDVWLTKLDDVTTLKLDNFYGLCSEAKSSDVTTFVTYKGGCGNFVLPEWIDKERCPFAYAQDFLGSDTSNEQKVFDLWMRANLTYSVLHKG
tara:strand:- start:1912 stop:2457 length:546 start_codon:yes stop_codon:yes gene_type:complete